MRQPLGLILAGGEALRDRGGDRGLLTLRPVSNPEDSRAAFAKIDAPAPPASTQAVT